MSQTFNDQAIVLKKQNIAEADRLYTLLTKTHGKVKAVAKGSRKIQSKLAGHLEPFSLVELMIADGRLRAKLANSKLIQSYSFNDLETFGLFSFWAETIDCLIKEHVDEKEIFQLTLDFFSQIKAGQNSSLILSYYLLRLLSHLGYQPELYHCVHCRQKINSDGNHFCFLHGGLVCANCLKPNEEKIEVSKNLIKLLRLILVENFSYWSKIKIGKELPRQLANLVFRYLHQYIDKEINSERFLKQITN